MSILIYINNISYITLWVEYVFGPLTLSNENWN